MRVIENIIAGGVTEDTTGISAERVFVVTEIPGRDDARLYTALTASKIPVVNENHPAIPDITVVNRTAEPVDKDKARVTVSYKLPDEEEIEPGDQTKPVIQVGAGVTGEETQRDINGDQITVDITFTDGTTDTQAGTVAVQVPTLVISFQRKELINPIKKAIEFDGTINDRDMGPFFDRYTLLCKGIEGDSDDGGVTYNVRYTFEFNPYTWLAQIIYKDEETDKPHPDVDVLGLNGFTFARVYNETNFTSLGLDFSFNDVPN